ESARKHAQQLLAQRSKKNTPTQVTVNSDGSVNTQRSKNRGNSVASEDAGPSDRVTRMTPSPRKQPKEKGILLQTHSVYGVDYSKVLPRILPGIDASNIESDDLLHTFNSGQLRLRLHEKSEENRGVVTYKAEGSLSFIVRTE